MVSVEKDKTIKEVDSTKEVLRQAFGKNAKGIQESCYNFLDGLSIILLVFFKTSGEDGWTDGIALSDSKLLTDEERTILEQLTPYKSTLDRFKAGDQDFETKPQAGGAKPVLRKTGTSVKKANNALESFQKNPAEAVSTGGILKPPASDFTFSIDGAVKAVGDYIQKVDNQVHEITDTLGPTAFINNMPVDPFVPNPLQAIGIPPPKFQIPKYSILPFFEAVLEVIRLVVVFMPDDMPIFRKVMSITQAVYELSLGNWRQAIFTFIGFFGQNTARITSIGKLILQAWLLIDPTISSQLSKYAYKGVKSMFISFWLWIVHIVSPDFIWKPIGKFLDGINNTIEKGEEGMASLEEGFTKTLQSMGYEGYTVDLPTLQQIVGQGEDAPPIRFSFDDLQNLQTLITMPFFICSKEGQTILSSLAKTPARLVLELLNIPTLDEDLEEMCGASSADKMKSLAVSMADIVSKNLKIRNASGEAVPPPEEQSAEGDTEEQSKAKAKAKAKGANEEQPTAKARPNTKPQPQPNQAGNGRRTAKNILRKQHRRTRRNLST